MICLTESLLHSDSVKWQPYRFSISYAKMLFI